MSNVFKSMMVKMAAMTAALGVANDYGHTPRIRTHSTRTVTPSTEGHKEPTERVKDKFRRKQIQAKRNARRRKARR